MELINLAKKINRIGLVPTIKLGILDRLSITKNVHLIIEGKRLTIRSSTPDLQVAFSSLGDEFSVLSSLLDKDLSL